MSKEDKKLLEDNKTFTKYNTDKLNTSNLSWGSDNVNKHYEDIVSENSLIGSSYAFKQHTDKLNTSNLSWGSDNVNKYYKDLVSENSLIGSSYAFKQYTYKLNTSNLSWGSDNVNKHYEDIVSENSLKSFDNSIDAYNNGLLDNYVDDRKRSLDKSDSSSDLIFKKGAVTFLDILGWKGIYKNRIDALSALEKLIEFTKNRSKNITQEVNVNKEKAIKTEVISISDTIVILSEGDDICETIKIHSDICSNILKFSMEECMLPLRGAISYGEYAYRNNILIGKAVDEAASWHESTDWIGVILSPTAQLLLGNKCIGSITKYKYIPLKNNYKYIDFCINWELDEKFKKDDFILNNSPLLPDVAGKYMNTFAFFKYVDKHGKTEEVPAPEGC